MLPLKIKNIALEHDGVLDHVGWVMSSPTLSQTIVCVSTFMSTAHAIENLDICASAELLVQFLR